MGPTSAAARVRAELAAAVESHQAGAPPRQIEPVPAADRRRLG